MKTIEVKEVYRCEFCRKIYLRKGDAKYHETICRKNPENIPACWDCEFFANGGYGYYCKKHKKSMYPLYRNKMKRGRAKNLGDVEMPKECEDYKVKFV